MDPLKLTLTVEEMAAAIGVSRTTAYNLANSKGFPTIRVGRKILISASGLERWVEENQGRCV